jgi:uncharacterized protein YbaP (TraB family)
MKLFPTAFFSILAFLSCKNKNMFVTQKNGKSLLWEISGMELRQPSYFLGTMHLMCAEDVVLSPNVQMLIKNVDRVYFEVDLDNASELFSGLLELRSKNGKTLSNTLNEEDYNKVKSFFEKFQPDVPFSVLEMQPPLMISASLYELLLPCEQKNGVEIKIVDEAYKQKKETRGLETIAFQASIFDSIPYADQANDLVKAIDSLEKNRKTMAEMIKVYKEQDIEQLYAMSSNDDSGVSNYIDLLLFKRNRNWIGQFPAIAKDLSTLFAVGAGHLGGEQGVLQLLRAQGYTVRALVN